MPSAPLQLIQCDLADLSSVQSAARSFIAKEQKLDVLILNAGVMFPPPSTTPAGYEMQFGTNHVGHALLTKLLLPTLLKTASQPGSDVRVVTLTSVGHIAAPWNGIAFADLKTDMKGYTRMARYAQSKLANILFTRELARRYPTLTAVSVHPGIVDTELWRTTLSGWLGGFNGLFMAGKKVFYSSPEVGATNQLWAAVGKKGDGKGEVKTGEYYTPVGVAGQGSWQSQDPKLAEKLWEWTEKELEGCSP